MCARQMGTPLMRRLWLLSVILEEAATAPELPWLQPLISFSKHVERPASRRCGISGKVGLISRLRPLLASGIAQIPAFQYQSDV